ncbi:cytochrome b [Alteromonas gracilis]|uniref:cytochrome b n=1 Tax=Alteromonas gracilis TaxID=1479524 RepID=UPI0030CB5648
MKTKWSFTIIIVHWVSAIVVIGMFSSGLWMVDLTYYSDWYKTAPHWHKSVGLLLLFVTVFRLLTRLMSARPPSYGSKAEKMLSKVGHGLIYVLLLALFASGYLISTADGRGIEIFNWFSVPSLGEFFDNQEDLAGEVHFYLAWSLIGLAVLHAGAALKHHFFNKDDTMKQMLRLR